MHSKVFVKNFEKTAGPIGAMIGTGLKTIGKGIMRVGGGPLNTVLTGAQAIGDFNQNRSKMIQAGLR